ncbi:MAG: hypothetical protein Q9188_005307 [Gyalolechia gomerana]
MPRSIDIATVLGRMSLPVLPIAQQELQDFRSHSLRPLTSTYIPQPAKTCPPQMTQSNPHAVQAIHERWVSFDRKVQQRFPKALHEQFQDLSIAIRAEESDMENLYIELRKMFLQRNEHELWKELLTLLPSKCKKTEELGLGEMRVLRQMANSSEVVQMAGTWEEGWKELNEWLI